MYALPCFRQLTLSFRIAPTTIEEFLVHGGGPQLRELFESVNLYRQERTAPKPGREETPDSLVAGFKRSFGLSFLMKKTLPA